MTSNDMPPPSLLSTLSHPLTLLVAISTSPPLGIGHANQLPWPPLKSDLAFFSRVTRRVPKPPNPTNASTTVADGARAGAGDGAGAKKINALLMGRRTYFSLPPTRRPLIARLSMVITRSPGTLRAALCTELAGKTPEALKGAEVLVAGSVEEGIRQLTDSYGERLGKVFVVGGGEIYKRVLEMEGSGAMRVVVTEVRKRDGGDFECDTFFPVDVKGSERESGGAAEGWRAAGSEEVGEWVGEKVEDGWKGEGESDVEVRIVGYEKGEGA